MIVESNGLRFSVEDVGDGVPVLLLHGFPDTSRLWRHQVRALSHAGYRAIVPDLRGRGQSERSAAVASYRLPNLVDDVTGLLDTLGLARVHVVGHDWGAAVAWLLAARAPERVDRLMALSVGLPGASGRPDLDELQKGWYRILFALPDVAEALLQEDGWSLARLLFRSHPDLEGCLHDLSRPGALTAALNWYRANVGVDRLLHVPSQLPTIQASTLGVWSTGDDFLTERGMTASASQVSGGWRYERIENAGHWIPLEQPERVSSLLLDFLQP